MEFLGTHALRQRVRASLVPQTLAQRVGRSLTRPAEVAVDLERKVRVVHGGVLAQVGLHVRLIPHARAVRHLLAQVESDIDDHAGGTQLLRVKQAHTVARIVHVAQLRHERLGVERPALAVAGVPAGGAAPQIEVVLQQRRGDLQVMTRHALVMDGGELLPRVEGVLASRHGPPHAARTREVLRRTGVKDPTGTRRIDEALNRLCLLRNIELRAIQLRDDAVRRRLHPRDELLAAVQRVALLAVELAHRGAWGAFGAVQLVRDLFLLRADFGDAIQAPLIGLVQIHGVAHKELGETLVALAAHRVMSRGLRLQLGRQPGGELLEGALGTLDLWGLGVDSQAFQEGAIGKRIALANDLVDLAGGRHRAMRSRFKQRALVAVERARDLRHAGTDCIDLLRCLVRHEHEGVADGLHRRRNVIELAQVLAVVVKVEFQAQAVAQDGGGHVVDVVEVVIIIRLVRAVVQGVQVRHHLARAVRDGGVVLGREVLEFAVESGNAQRRRCRGRERGEIVNKVIARGVQQRGLAVRTHKAEVYPLPRGKCHLRPALCLKRYPILTRAGPNQRKHRAQPQESAPR